VPVNRHNIDIAVQISSLIDFLKPSKCYESVMLMILAAWWVMIPRTRLWLLVRRLLFQRVESVLQCSRCSTALRY